MSQFRNTADVLNEILQKAGEPINGNSPFEARAVTYANKVHHAIIAGGNIFNIEVDEPWVWARSRFPIVLELEPAYTIGSVTCTVNDINITFSTAPSASLEGWHFQVNGKSTVYKITQHAAGNMTAQVDSSFLDDTGAYNFRAFKLDYEVRPVYLYVDNFNDKVDFQETVSTTLSTTLTHGAYTPNNLINHIVTQVGSVGANAYTGTFDSVLKQFSITRTTTTAGTLFNLLGVSGPNSRRNGQSLIGFDCLDYTAGTSYTSSYTPNSISRLIEPFKIFSSSYDDFDSRHKNQFIYSSDPIKMQEDYPIALTRQRIPDRFVRLTEENDGTVWVRFNTYPKNKTKVSIDWIPTPQDLQDNNVSHIKLPRGDVDTLIHGAACFIAFDKEDSKFQNFLDLTKSGLQAMKKKNHGLLFRTGEFFGQIVPRLDLAGLRRDLRYGYTVSGSTAAATTAESVQSMISVTMSYVAFQTAATTSTVLAHTLPANRSLFALITKHSQSFTGAGITTVSVDVGITGAPTQFINAFNVSQATAASAQDSSLVLFYPAAATGINVRIKSVGANLNALTQGSLVLYFQETIVT